MPVIDDLEAEGAVKTEISLGRRLEIGGQTPGRAGQPRPHHGSAQTLALHGWITAGNVKVPEVTRRHVRLDRVRNLQGAWNVRPQRTP